MADGLAGKVAVITGGSTGIGKAVAADLVARGVQVILAGRNTDRGEQVAAAMRGTHQPRFIAANVGREADVQRLFDEVVHAFGGVDLLFNNAGVEGTLGPIALNTEQSLDEVFATNIKGVFLCMKHALPQMSQRGGGVVVNNASFVGTTVPFPNGIAYGASKAAVLSMTRAVAVGFADQNIRSYAICPWMTDTPMADRLTGGSAEAKAQFGSMNPSGRIATPQDIAGVVSRMFEDGAGLDSGDAVLVDSGGTTQKVRPLSV